MAISGRLLGLGGKVWVAGVHIDWERNVLQSDQPFPVDLPVAVGDTHCEVELRTVFSRHDSRLDAMGIGQLVARYNAEVLNFKLIDGAWKSTEKVLPILFVGFETN